MHHTGNQSIFNNQFWLNQISSFLFLLSYFYTYWHYEFFGSRKYQVSRCIPNTLVDSHFLWKFVFCFYFRPRPYLFERDHKFPTSSDNLPVIVLYAEIGTRAFAEFHRVLSKKSKNGKILYVLRHYIQVHVCIVFCLVY